MEFFLKQLFAGLGLDPSKLMAQVEEFANEAQQIARRFDTRLAALEAANQDLRADMTQALALLIEIQRRRDY